MCCVHFNDSRYEQDYNPVMVKDSDVAVVSVQGVGKCGTKELIGILNHKQAGKNETAACQRHNLTQTADGK